ncbi:MAG: hypothetical protein ACRBN8_39595 [Nannocystales bacterium]
MRRTLLSLCLLTACGEPALSEVELTRWTQWVAGARIVEGPPKVDVLLVVDDSPSMHDQAGLLADNLRAIAAVYESEWLDYRIGVITTHVAGPDCTSGRDGGLVRTSCRERLPSFVTSANQESPAVDLRQVCTDSCSLDEVTTLPTSVGPDDTARPRAWLERGGAGQNTADPVEALVCLGQVGVSGCTAESPLGAVQRFLDRAEDPEDPDFGFLREDAGLSIVFIGDEDDCSRASATSLRGGGSVSAACWRAGADCVEGEEGVSCEAASSPDLLDLDGFVERLLEIDANKRLARGRDGQRVFVSAVAGVPPGYPDLPQPFEPGADPAFEDAFGVGAGCVRDDVVGAPSVRTVAVAESFAPWQSSVVSACVPNWTAALACLPGPSLDAPPPFCLDVELLAEGADLSEYCVMTETRGGQTRRLPECNVEDTDACVLWVPTMETPDYCLDRGLGAAVFLRRRDPSWETLEYEVTCAAEI